MDIQTQRRRLRAAVIATATLLTALAADAAPTLGTAAFDASDAWLAYAPVGAAAVGEPSVLPDTLRVLGRDARQQSAATELLRGWRGMLGLVPRRIDGTVADGSLRQLVIGTRDQLHAWEPTLDLATPIAAESFRLMRQRVGARDLIVVAGGDDSGVLYGAFELLRRVAQQQPLASVDDRQSPSAPIRWINQWDNPDGSIERGYSGESIFFEQGSVRADLSRVPGYGRLLASVGINGVTINNVNADARMLQAEHLRQIARIADAFRPWGVRVSMSIKMNSPQLIGGLPGFDPQQPEVAAWWQHKVDEIYRLIPDFAGVIIKADSEGQPGPAQYGRTPADAANVLARPLKAHGGVVLYRGFVYNHHLDWRDPKADRARAGYDNFVPLDGRFDDNVIVQIKHGPIDFQTREPVSPLFGGLRRTNVAIELQIAQEYTGQQRHLIYLPTMWKQVLDFDLRVDGRDSRVRDIVSGQRFARPLGGYAGVANVGLDAFWLGHPLALANLYGYGRLAWNPQYDVAGIADEWTRLSLGNDAGVVATTNRLLNRSWSLYESYTGPLGGGTLTDILHVHYGPGIESSERNGWGQWHRGDRRGIGMDRTVATGTGYIGQYPPEVAAQYETLEQCPDELLLFMHHVPYRHRLHSGKTLIQHVYDTHYQGAAEAEAQVDDWATLQGRIPAPLFDETLRRLRYQAGHAVVWRDAIVQWFAKTSGIADAQRRVGRQPGRIEAESLELDGYKPVAATPWETASQGRAVQCTGGDPCSAELLFDGNDGWYDIAVQYFDLAQGQGRYALTINGQSVDAWRADDTLPSDRIGGHTATRRVIAGVALHRGDRVIVRGHADGPDVAALDYIEITPPRRSAAAQARQEIQ